MTIPTQPEESGACFVVSTGRCGSTYLSDILNHHPDVLSLSEFLHAMRPSPFLPPSLSGTTFAARLARIDPFVTAIFRRHEEPAEWIYPVDEDGRFDRSTGVPAVAVTALPHLVGYPDATYDDLLAFVSQLPPAPVGRQYTAVFEWLRRRFGGRCWVERSGGSLELLASIMEHFPDAKYIHLHRDGREVAISARRYDRSLRGLPRFLVAAARYEDETGTDLTALDAAPDNVPQWLRQLMAEAAGEVEPTPVPLEWFGQLWSAAILKGLRQLRRVPRERVLQIAYEDLVNHPSQTLHRIAEFLDVDADDAWIAWARSAARPASPRWPLLSVEDRTRLDSVCRVANRRLYGPEGPPALPLELAADETG